MENRKTNLTKKSDTRKPQTVGLDSGFSLVEVMVTVSVVAIILIGIMLGNTAIQQASQAAFERTRATQDAHRVIENIRMIAQTGAFPSEVVDEYPDGDEVDGFDALHDEEVVVSYQDTSGDSNLTNDSYLDVTVTVSWLENGTRETSSSLRAFINQR